MNAAPVKTVTSASSGHYNSCHIYARLLRYAAPYWFSLALLMLVSLAGAPLALLVPVPLKIAVDSVIGDKPLPAPLRAILPDAVAGSASGVISALAVLVVSIAVLASLQQLAASLLKTYVGERLIIGFRSQLFRHVQRLSLSYHDTKGTADSIYRIQHDAPAIQSLILRSIVPTVTAVFTLSSMLYVTAQVNAKLALVAMAVSPPLLLLTVGFSGHLRRRWRQVKELESSMQSVVQEVLTSVRVVKAFGREEDEQKRLTAKYQQGLRAQLRAGLHENFYNLLVGTVTAGITAVVLYVGASDVLAGKMTLGDLVLVMAYLKQLYEPLKTIGQQFASKQKALASAERALGLLDESTDVEERPGARPINRARGSVSFEEVGFSYAGDASVLRHVSFDVEPGTRVGITGRTGAGKTTLVSLLTRFYDVTSGRILLDGVDLRDYRLADLRNQFGIVLQDPVLFSSSIAENIAYGRPGATREEIIGAARAANAHEFIEAFPEGYDTRVGERGARLSGGERQRISLARAFLKDAPILILDEPTSSIDAKTEELIINAMERLMRGRTAFMIAHRLATLRSCDVRLHIEDGRVVRQQVGVTQDPQLVLAVASAPAEPVTPFDTRV